MESTLPPNSQPKHRWHIGSLFFSILLFSAAYLLWQNFQYVVDTARFWSYQPSSAVQDITAKTDLTDTGKFIFYASEPSVDGKAAFNKECEQKESGTAILGCYTAGRIYIYDVTDTRLDGIKEVTAAHEMLHAVYERMSASEKKTVNALVETEYQKLQSNPDYTERMAFYARTEPGERDNELHSIIGTEVGSVSPELEAHYSKYFKDRNKVVAQYNAYNGAFASLADQAKVLSGKLDSMNAQIKTLSATYASDVKKLNTDISAFNLKSNSGGFSSQAEFNAERQALVNRSNDVTAERNQLNTLIDTYNDLREQYNNIVTQSNDLYDSIDSSPAPAPTI